MAYFKPYLFKAPLLLLVCAALLSACQDEDTHPGQPVTKREHIFKDTLHNFQIMKLMVQGKEPYSTQDFLDAAQQVKALSTQPWVYFPPGSDYSPSRAKPDVWQHPEAFRQAQEKFKAAAAQLVDVAKGGNLDQINPVYDHLKDTCSDCHHDFRTVSDIL